MFKRGSGILLHITSLPSGEYMGNMGPGAYAFVDFLVQAGQTYWQVLPLNPPSPGEGNSPYSSASAFAGNTYLISPEILAAEGLIPAEMAKIESEHSPERIDFKQAIEYKSAVLNKAYESFTSQGNWADYEQFCARNSYWITDYALFVALKGLLDGSGWVSWPEEIRERKPDALEQYAKKLAQEIQKQKFFQFLFYRQWMALKKYANEQGIEIFGDIPIYMSYQSADVWAHPEIFKLDEHRKPLFAAGVPPDYFSQIGQLWGNPVYNWDKLRETGFDWWLKRVEHNLTLFNILRIDHFRGLVAYWEVPASEKTAINGAWVGVPGQEFFDKLREHNPKLPIIAEDLGTITPDVREFIGRLEIPGMKVLLFAFGESLPENLYAPHNHVKNCVIYTGTHDNNTARGWFEGEATEAEKQSLVRYLGREIPAVSFNWELIRMALMSVGDIAILPMQDILGLGAESRMNTPSTADGNWEWRLTAEDRTPELALKLRDMTEIFGRLPKPI